MISPPLFPFYIPEDDMIDTKQATTLLGGPVQLHQSEDDRDHAEMEMRVVSGWSMYGTVCVSTFIHERLRYSGHFSDIFW